jgi:hypothetical protein
MTISEAHKISLMGYVASLGYKPTQTHNGRYVCNSPFRPEERTPSFYLYYDQRRGKWTYKDFGSNDKGGDIIDFIMTLHNVNELGALMILDSPELSVSKYLSFIGTTSKERPEPTITISHIQTLQNKALIQYLESRKIPANIAANYTKEAYYTTVKPDTGEIKKYFAICFKNIAGGYELRNKYFKGSTSPKSYSIIPGHPERLNVFEGFLDMISGLVYYQQPEPRNTTIVLNSLSHLRHLWEILPNFNQVNLFLDLDIPGRKATKEIQSRFPLAVNKSEIIHEKYKDFNEFLINQ